MPMEICDTREATIRSLNAQLAHIDLDLPKIRLLLWKEQLIDMYDRKYEILKRKKELERMTDEEFANKYVSEWSKTFI